LGIPLLSFYSQVISPKEVLFMITLPEINLRKEGGFLVRCECGFEVLLVPDVKLMAKAIEAHAAQHGEREKDPAKAASEKERIETDLIAKTLNAAADFAENKLP
jgi:hypothetical protein